SALAGVLGGTPSTSLALASVSLDPTLSCVIIGTLPEQRTAEEPANLADTGDLAVREDVHVGQECCDAVGGTGNASHSDTIGPDRPAAEILLCARALFSPGKISVLIASGPSASLELAAGVSFRSCSTKPARRTQSSASI
ncbi:for, partial [Symbiodinium sp. KB8]